MATTRPEMETVIRWDDETKVVSLWTASLRTKGILNRRGYKPTEINKTPDGKRERSWKYILPARSITVRNASIFSFDTEA